MIETRDDFNGIYRELRSHQDRIVEQGQDFLQFRQLLTSFSLLLDRHQEKNKQLAAQNTAILELMHILETKTNKRLLSSEERQKQTVDAETMTDDNLPSPSTKHTKDDQPILAVNLLETMDTTLVSESGTVKETSPETPRDKSKKKKSSVAPDLEDLMNIPPKNSFCLLPKKSCEATLVDLDCLTSPEKETPTIAAPDDCYVESMVERNKRKRRSHTKKIETFNAEPAETNEEIRHRDKDGEYATSMGPPKSKAAKIVRIETGVPNSERKETAVLPVAVIKEEESMNEEEFCFPPQSDFETSEAENEARNVSTFFE